MLKILRKKGVAKKVWWAVAIIIIISFGFFGTAYLFNSKSTSVTAGKIFNHSVSLSEFQRVYHEVETSLMMRFGEKFNEVRAYLDLDGQTWDRLILLFEANKHHIQVSDDDVVKSIAQYATFQRNGQFDEVLYNDVLKYYLRLKPREFEEGVRDTLRIAKLMEKQTPPINLSDEEITNEFKKQNEKVQVSYVLISKNSFLSQATASDTEISTYYEQHKNEFVLPPSINVQYISIDYPTDSKDADRQATRAKADKIYQDLSSNPNLTDVATKNGLTTMTSGFFSLDQPNTSLGWSFDILNAIFQLKPNQITTPLETSKGFVVIKLLEAKDGYVPELNVVKDKVALAVKKLKAQNLAKEKSKEVLKKLTDEINKTKLQDFAAAAKTLNLEIAQTSFFARGEYLPKIGQSPDFQQQAFGLSDQKKLSDPVEIENGVAILYLDNKKAADMSLFEKQKDTIAKKMYTERQNENFNNYLTQLRLQANLQDNISKLRNS